MTTVTNEASRFAMLFYPKFAIIEWNTKIRLKSINFDSKASMREIKRREDSLHVIVLIFQHSLTMALRKAIECWDLYPPHK
jgi:hypothetical protein